MDWLRKWDTLPQEVRQLILHNGADMERFYTPDELDATAKRK